MNISFVFHPMTRQWKRDDKGKVLVWLDAFQIWAYDNLINKEGSWAEK